MNFVKQRVPRSVVGLILFGGIVLPFSLFRKADSLSKMHLAEAWPFPWQYRTEKPRDSRRNDFLEMKKGEKDENDSGGDGGDGGDGEWGRIEGFPLKVSVVQLEEQCFAPSIVYGFRVGGKDDTTLYVNDSIGLKPYRFSFFGGRSELQDPFPFHFLSQETAKKFIKTLLDESSDPNKPKVIVRYKKSQPWISVLEIPISSRNKEEVYEIDHVLNPLTQNFPTHTPLIGTFERKESGDGSGGGNVSHQRVTRRWPIYASDLWPSRQRVYGQSSSFLTYPFYRDEGSTLLTGLMTPISILATGVYSWKLKKTQPLLVVGVLTWTVGWSLYGYFRPHLTPAMEFTKVPPTVTNTNTNTTFTGIERIYDYFVTHRYVKSYGLIKSRECHCVVPFDQLSSASSTPSSS